MPLAAAAAGQPGQTCFVEHGERPTPAPYKTAGAELAHKGRHRCALDAQRGGQTVLGDIDAGRAERADIEQKTIGGSRQAFVQARAAKVAPQAVGFSCNASPDVLRRHGFTKHHPHSCCRGYPNSRGGHRVVLASLDRFAERRRQTDRSAGSNDSHFDSTAPSTDQAAAEQAAQRKRHVLRFMSRQFQPLARRNSHLAASLEQRLGRTAERGQQVIGGN